MEAFKPIEITDQVKPYLADPRLKECQKEIGYDFNEPAYLLEALWHSSNKEIGDFSYERMEFLGDTILQYITGLYLFKTYPNEDEGLLTKRRANIVSSKALSLIAKENRFDHFIFINEHLKNNLSNSILCDLYESIIAAIYSDGGLKPCEVFVMNTLKKILTSPLSDHQNYKSELQEWLQKNQFPVPIYQVVDTKGPHHQLIFEMILQLNDITYGPVNAKSKKEGEQLLAQLAFESLGLSSDE